LGHPCKFQRLSHLGSIPERHSSSGRQPNFAVLNRGHHLYSAGRPSRWALAHILVAFAVMSCHVTSVSWQEPQELNKAFSDDGLLVVLS